MKIKKLRKSDKPDMSFDTQLWIQLTADHQAMLIN